MACFFLLSKSGIRVCDFAVLAPLKHKFSSLENGIHNQVKFLSVDHVAKWKRYRTLWKLEKTLVMEKFAAKNPSAVAYDDKLLFYSRIAEDVINLAAPKVFY